MNENNIIPIIEEEEEKTFDNLTDEEREEFEEYLRQRDKEQLEELANDPNFGPEYFD